MPEIIPTVGASTKEQKDRILRDLLPRAPASESRLARMLAKQSGGAREDYGGQPVLHEVDLGSKRKRQSRANASKGSGISHLIATTKRSRLEDRVVQSKEDVVDLLDADSD